MASSIELVIAYLKSDANGNESNVDLVIDVPIGGSHDVP